MKPSVRGPCAWLAALAAGSAIAAAWAQPAPTGKGIAEPERLDEGWNLPAPPLPAEVLEGTALTRAVKIRRTDGQPVADAWLKKEIQALELDVDGRVTPLVASGGDFKLSWQAQASGQVRAKLRARTASGVKEGPVKLIQVLPNVRLKAADKVDFAQVQSGCALDEHCKPVDLSGSQQLRGGQKLAVSRPAAQPGGAPGWPELNVYLRQGAGQPLVPIVHGQPPIQIEWAADKPLEVCYAAPKCVAPPASTAEAVLLQPLGKGLVEPERAATVLLLAAVTANPFWVCYWPYLAGAVGALLLIFILIGIFKPHQFPKSAALFVGSQESQLARDSGRPLYSAPGARRGFYRSATCTFDGSGMTVRRGSGGVLVLHAKGNDILVEARTELEVKERQRWRVVPAEEKVLQRGMVHRVGKSFFFRVD